MSKLPQLLASILFIVGVFLPGISHAQSWTMHQLEGVSFQVPDGWNSVSSQIDHALVFADASGRELRVEWWLQDEPILGYADILSHKDIRLDGKAATWIHSSFPSSQSLTLVAKAKRKDQRQLLLHLEVPGQDSAAAIGFFDEILARVRFDEPGTRSNEGAARPDSVPAVDQGSSVLKASQVLTPKMQAVARYFDNACEPLDPAAWNHPVLLLIHKRKYVRFEWAMLCRSLPVLGLNFKYDPRGQTSDFFLPFYDDILNSGTETAFSIVSIKDGLIIDLKRPAKDELSIDYRDAPELAGDTWQNKDAQIASNTISTPAVVEHNKPVPDQDDPRFFIARTSFSAPMEWNVRNDSDNDSISFIRPDGKAEIRVMLWPSKRPLPSDHIERLEHMVIADAPAVRYLQKTTEGNVLYVFFEEGYTDGSRISVAYQSFGEPLEDGAAIFELFLADLQLKDSPPSGRIPSPSTLGTRVDPFASLDMSDFEISR